MSRPKFSVRMVYLLLGVFAIVALAPLASVAWRLIDDSREIIKTSRGEYQHLLASTISRELDAYVGGLRSQLRSGAHSLASAKTGSGAVADESVRRVLDEIVDDRVLYLRFTDMHGRVLQPRVDEEQPGELEPLFVAGFRSAAESLAGERAGEGSAARPAPVLLPADPPTAALLIAEPVVSKGRFLGVVSALVDLQSVWESVMDSRREPHAMFAVDGSGRLFAKRNLEVELGRDMAGSEIVQRFKDTTGSVSEVMPFRWSPDGTAAPERYLGSYTVSKEGWGIFVQASERQVYRPVSEMIRNTLAWGLLALAGALLAATVFARNLADPIKRLAEMTRAFSRRDYSARVAIPAIVEVGELAERFNQMADDIEEHIRQLKRAADENHELFIGTANALTSAIDAKDPYTEGHSKRVNEYSVILARYHGLSEAQIEDIDIASLLHDVGKIGVDDAILNKKGTLTEEEFAVMKRHTTIGEKIMEPIKQMKSMLPGLRSHHERWAGGGYPDGLAGDAIPLMARIIAVADSFDAMTTDRPYQKAMTFEAARKRLNDLKRTGFDERIVDSFNRAYDAGKFTKKPVAEPAIV